MKLCPKCNGMNHDEAGICRICGNPLVIIKKKKSHEIFDALLWIIAGIVLIFLDIDMDFAIAKLIRIPYILGLLGVGFVITGFEIIIKSIRHKNNISPLSGTLNNPRSNSQDNIPNYILTIIVGIIGGCAFSLLWYFITTLSQYHLGVLSVGLGYIIGTCVVIGANHKRGWKMQFSSFIITLCLLFSTEYLIMRHFYAQYLIEQGFTQIPLILPINILKGLFGIAINNEPISILYWLLSIGFSIVIPGNIWIKSFSKKNPMDAKSENKIKN